MKIKLYERLKRNELTNSIIIALETMPMEQLSKNSIVKVIKEAMNIFDIIYIENIHILLYHIKEIHKKSIKQLDAKLDKLKLEMCQEDKARIDQIKFCLNNRFQTTSLYKQIHELSGYKSTQISPIYQHNPIIAQN
jgi:hypothetical protein